VIVKCATDENGVRIGSGEDLLRQVKSPASDDAGEFGTS
jgi:hypothetical protein